MKALAVFFMLVCLLLLFPDLMTVAYNSGINGGIVIALVVGTIIAACWGGTDANSDLR